MVRSESRGVLFGTLLALLPPGFVALWGARYHIVGIENWLGAGARGGPTFAGFLYGLLGAMAIGINVNAIRWLIADGLIFGELREKPPAPAATGPSGQDTSPSPLADHQYWHYLCYGNLFVALLIAYLSRLCALASGRLPFWDYREAAFLAALIALVAILAVGAWDARRKYIARTRHPAGE